MGLKKPTPQDFITGTTAKDVSEQKAPEVARLNANIPVELHMALKMRATKERTTIGRLIEDWIRSWHKP